MNSSTYTVVFPYIQIKKLTVALLVFSFLIQPFGVYAQVNDVTSAQSVPDQATDQGNQTSTGESSADILSIGSPASKENLLPLSATPEEVVTTEVDEGVAVDENSVASALLGYGGDSATGDKNTTEERKFLAQPDVFSGALSYQYPMNIPPGRNGLTPNISLTYNNQMTDEVN